LSHPTNPFFDRSHAWGWLWTLILLISVSWVVRITGVIHWHLAALFLVVGLSGLGISNSSFITWIPLLFYFESFCRSLLLAPLKFCRIHQ
jgi:hypothetical protein